MYQDVQGKKLLIIGADAGNIHIIDQAKKMGVYTIAIDWETDHSKCPAKLVSDEAWDMSYRDIEAVAHKCKEQQVDGVIAGYSEYRVLCAARIAQACGFSFYVTPEQMELTRNKRTFKGLCEKYGVAVPKEYCKDGKITEEEKDCIEYPVIVKPADYGGRIGISVCYNRQELDIAIEDAFKYSEDHQIVVEQYITGTELAAIYTLANGEISLSLINDKYLSKEGQKYAALCDVALTPSKYYEKYIKQIDEKVREFLKGIGMRDGVAFFQLIATDNNIYAFEMGLRLNGGNDWKVINANNGINACEMLIRHSLTGYMGGDLRLDNPGFDTKLCTYVMYVHAGTIGKIDYRRILNVPEIIDVHPYFTVGKVVNDRGTTQQKAFSIKIKENSIEELADRIQFIQENVVIEDIEGNNMLFDNFDVKRLLQ